MKMSKNALIRTFAVILTLGGLGAFAAPSLFIAKELGIKDANPSQIDLKRAFEDPLPALVKNGEVKKLMQLENCEDFLQVRGNIIGSDNDNDYRILRLQTVPCLAMAILKTAKIATNSALPENFLLFTDTVAYPASLWPAVSDDERQSLARPEATLLTASKKPALRKLNNETLSLESGNFGLHLTLLARGDFDRDGWEDAAFRWEGYAIHGSYSDARLVVLSRTDVKSRLHELPLEKLLAP